MNVSNAVLPGQLGSEALADLADAASNVVLAAKDRLAPNGQALRRTRQYSMRELAAEVGVSHQTVGRYITEHKSAFSAIAPSDVETIVRRPMFTVSDLVRLREGLGRLPARTSTRAIRIPFVNFKGGVSKSTCAAHAAIYLALKGFRVLSVDCDPQGTLSTLFGLHPDIGIDTEDTLYPYLIGDTDTLQSVIRPTHIPTLNVIPAALGLSGADFAIPGRQSNELKKRSSFKFFELLDHGLRTVDNDFDVVIIDCPPTMAYLTTIAVYAADGLIIPLRPSMPDFASSAQFLTMLANLTEQLDGYSLKPKEFQWIRWLITQSDTSSASREMEDLIRFTYRDRVIGPTFPHLSAVSTAAKNMSTVYDLDPRLYDRRTIGRAIAAANDVNSYIEDLVLRSRTPSDTVPTTTTTAEVN